MSQPFDGHTAEFIARTLQAWPALSGPEMDWWIQHPKDLQAFLGGLRRNVGDEKVYQFLGNRCVVQLPERSGLGDPGNLFVTRDGLYVWDGFRDRIVAAARPFQGTPACEIASFDIVRNANDRENQSELPVGYLFEDPSQFCGLLFGIIDRQAGGKYGPLLTNGYWNIFYVLVNGEVFAVRVGWDAVSRGWYVDANPLNDGRWHAGLRVFSRNC